MSAPTSATLAVAPHASGTNHSAPNPTASRSQTSHPKSAPTVPHAARQVADLTPKASLSQKPAGASAIAGIGQDKHCLRASHAYVTEPPLLVDRTIQVGKHPLFDGDHPDMRKLEPLGSMQGGQHHSALFRLTTSTLTHDHQACGQRP